MSNAGNFTRDELHIIANEIVAKKYFDVGRLEVLATIINPDSSYSKYVLVISEVMRGLRKQYGFFGRLVPIAEEIPHLEVILASDRGVLGRCPIASIRFPNNPAPAIKEEILKLLGVKMEKQPLEFLK